MVSATSLMETRPISGRPEPRIGDRRAGQIERLEAGLGRQRGGQRIVDAGRDERSSAAAVVL